MWRRGNFPALFFLVLAARLRLAVIDAVSCKETSYNLSKQRYIYFASPNYPKKFESQTQCNWLLVAPRGYRVKLVFIKFYLANAQRLCIHQKVQIDDLLSGKSDGPYCGNTLPPVLRSAGQMLRIKLQSDARNINQQYVGFQAKVIATKEPSSIRIRDDMGKWRSYGGGSSGASVLQPPGANVELDENDNSNEATELRNKMRNFQNNMKTLTEGNAEFKPLDGASNNGRIKPFKPKKPTKRKRPSTRAVSVPTTRRHMEQHEHGHAENELHHGLIIAIACGIMFLLALTFAAYNYCKKRGCIGKPESVTTLAAATRTSAARKNNSDNFHKHRQQQHYADDYRQLSSPSVSSRQHALPGSHVMMKTSSASLTSTSSPATTTTTSKVMTAPATPPRPHREHKRHHHHHHHRREQRSCDGHERKRRRHHSNHAAAPHDRQGAGRSGSNRH